MYREKRVRYWEWGTFAGLLAVVCMLLTFLPVPTDGQPEDTRKRLQLVILPDLEVAKPPVEEAPEEDPGETSEQEDVLSSEDMAALLDDAFGALDQATENMESPDLESRTSNALTLDTDLDLEAWETSRRSDRLDVVQKEGQELRGRSNPNRRLSPTLVQPDISGLIEGEGDYRVKIEAGSGGSGGGSGLPLTSRAPRRPPPMSFTDFQESVTPDALAEWIKGNPAELDPAIKTQLGVGRGTVTARASYETEEGTFELQMMLRPSNGEVRIVLIDGADLYLFVSPRARQRASYFQRGSVDRDGTGSVVTVEAEDMSPQGKDAQAFYGLFSAWWEKAKT